MLAFLRKNYRHYMQYRRIPLSSKIRTFVKIAEL